MDAMSADSVKQPRPRRSATQSLLSIVLALDAVLVFFVMMTAFGDVETAVKAVRAGAYHFLTKPFRSNDEVVLVCGQTQSTDFPTNPEALRRAGADLVISDLGDLLRSR